MKETILEYYNTLAKSYDENRFSNTYGKYIHKQEIEIIERYLSAKSISKNLDVACGTGRFLTYADYGVDLSPEMVNVSRQKYPQKSISVGNATSLDVEDSFFDNVTSFHLMMHLDKVLLVQILDEVNRVCKKDGYFIFDIPSKKRRKLMNYQSQSWHGGYQIAVEELVEISKKGWKEVSYHGVAFFPIHRIPKRFRKWFTRLDSLLCNSIFKEYSSHLVFILKKK